jgi:hypothetical protein
MCVGDGQRMPYRALKFFLPAFSFALSGFGFFDWLPRHPLPGFAVGYSLSSFQPFAIVPTPKKKFETRHLVSYRKLIGAGEDARATMWKR